MPPFTACIRFKSMFLLIYIFPVIHISQFFNVVIFGSPVSGLSIYPSIHRGLAMLLVFFFYIQVNIASALIVMFLYAKQVLQSQKYMYACLGISVLYFTLVIEMESFFEEHLSFYFWMDVIALRRYNKCACCH